MAAIAEPKLVAFHQNGSPTDYKALRYGLASCLLDDGYFAFTDDAKGYSGVVWFDEYDAKLGQAVTPPATTAWQKGVYRRDFENGIALVNPRGNGPVEVTLEEDFRRLDGKQAPTVNNGAADAQGRAAGSRRHHPEARQAGRGSDRAEAGRSALGCLRKRNQETGISLAKTPRPRKIEDSDEIQNDTGFSSSFVLASRLRNLATVSH